MATMSMLTLRLSKRVIGVSDKQQEFVEAKLEKQKKSVLVFFAGEHNDWSI